MGIRPKSRHDSLVGIDVIVACVAVAVAVVLVACGVLSSLGISAESLQRHSRGYGCSRAVLVDPPREFSIEQVPEYSGDPICEINGNKPFFESRDFTETPFETYSDLDRLGRCGTAFALVGPETMPTTGRGSIGMVKPSGWQIAEYGWVDGRYLYNRCHLIAYALSGENDNSLNLITGTRSMNVAGMLPYEERVASYIDATGNHVLYRVTPVFEGDNLVASGVLMEAESVEDGGAGVQFCVWCYNVEPGVAIDYATGENWADGTRSENADADVSGVSDAGEGTGQGAAVQSEASADSPKPSSGEHEKGYILNVRTHRLHRPECPAVADMNEKNKQVFDGTREEAIQAGYEPCGICNP